MKLEIYNDTTPEPETVVRLRLVKTCRDIMLVAVDEDGKRLDGGNILRIDAYGAIVRCRNISSSFGFDIDENGRVKTN